MIDLRLLIPIIAGFMFTLFLMPFWIRKAKQIGLVWEDMNKFKAEKVMGSGGLICTLGFLIAIFFYIFYKVFLLKDPSNLIEILALLLVIAMLSAIGLIDDLLGWQRGGLSRRSRIILVILASIPLIVINAGKHTISLPFLGVIDAGIWYPLILIPLGIVGVTTTFNFLAGFNGLEAGQGIILLLGATIVSYFTGNPWISVICLSMIFCLLAFLIFNFSPAKVFPGDSLTYAVGGLFAMASILGNFEKIAAFFFIPYILETVLEARGGLIKQSFGKPDKENYLSLKYDKIYGLTHLGIFILQKVGIKLTERKVVLLIWLFQLIIILLGFIIFQQGIFA